MNILYNNNFQDIHLEKKDYNELKKFSPKKKSDNPFLLQGKNSLPAQAINQDQQTEIIECWLKVPFLPFKPQFVTYSKRKLLTKSCH